MPNLKDRLKRIQESRKDENKKVYSQAEETNVLKNQGWEVCGFKVLKREVTVPSPFKKIKKLPEALSVIIPDLKGQDLPAIEDFLFFDLETTGLSGGAGTVAFLAAFGNTVSDSFKIKQYLLLDYPGENDFLENVLGHLKQEQSVVVSYNGKCFDSQIIKTRCLMNRINPPLYRHVDLLHPARRLWKNMIQDCSQASVETEILGLDRSNDIPGFLAPEIWFDFLKTGSTDRLTGICDHNKIDISGLAKMLAYVISIADNPFNEKNIYDTERLALYWRKNLRKFDDHRINENLINTGKNLLRFAAEKKYPQAVYVYAFDQMQNCNYREAYEYVNYGLDLFETESIWHEKLLRRKSRLEKKLNCLHPETLINVN